MDGGAYLSFLPLPRTPSRLSSFRSTDGRSRTRTLLAHHFNAICGGGGGVCRGPRTTTSFAPKRELPLARLVIHRQTSARAPRKETPSVQSRSGIWRSSAPNSISYGYRSSSALPARATRRLLLGGGGGRNSPVHRFLASEPLHLRTHRRGPVLQASTRDTLSCKDRHQPTGFHGHVSRPLVKADMV